MVLLALALTLESMQWRQPRLVVGSPAPQLQLEEWLQGPPTTRFRKGDVYLLEFWATWCQPCLSSSPHMTALQKRYGSRGLHVIGITHLDKWGSTPDNIRRMITKMGSKMSYPIAIDAKALKPYQGVFSGKTECAYLGDAEVMAIPAAFLVDRAGRIAYIGLPSLVDETLDAVMNGSFDPETAAASYLKHKSQESAFRQFENELRAKRFGTAYALGWRLVDEGIDPRLGWFLADSIIQLKDESDQDLRLALECAKAAVAESHGKEPGMLATLAGVYHCLGNNSEAKVLLKRAYSEAELEQKATLRELAGRYGFDLSC